MALFAQYLPDPGWHETLQLAVGFVGVIQQRTKAAGAILRAIIGNPTDIYEKITPLPLHHLPVSAWPRL